MSEAAAPLRDDVVDRLRDVVVRGPYGEMMDARLVEAVPDRAVVEMAILPHHMNGADRVHGGALAGLVDIAATATAWATNAAEAETRGTTVAVTVNFLSPGRDGSLRAEGTILRRGGSLSIVRVHVTDGQGNGVAEGQITYRLDLRRG